MIHIEKSDHGAPKTLPLLLLHERTAYSKQKRIETNVLMTTAHKPECCNLTNLLLELLKRTDILTPKASTILCMAQKMNRDIILENILSAIVSEGTSAAAIALKLEHLDTSKVTPNSFPSPSKNPSAESTHEFWRLAELSWNEAIVLDQDYIGPEHLLLAITADPAGKPLISNIGIDPSKLRQRVLHLIVASK